MRAATWSLLGLDVSWADTNGHEQRDEPPLHPQEQLVLKVERDDSDPVNVEVGLVGCSALREACEVVVDTVHWHGR